MQMEELIPKESVNRAKQNFRINIISAETCRMTLHLLKKEILELFEIKNSLKGKTIKLGRKRIN